METVGDCAMSLLTIEAEVIRIAAEELGADPADITSSTRLDELFSDSLEYVAFIVRLCNDVHQLSDEVISHCETIGDLQDACVNPN